MIQREPETDVVRAASGFAFASRPGPVSVEPAR